MLRVPERWPRSRVRREVVVSSKRGFKLAAFLGIASLLALPGTSFGAVFISVAIAPPVLPIYAQPLCPGPDYIWTPGYWAYGPAGYFWVPGTWILAPEPGLLWTPGYWGFASGLYVWHAGYWGPHVGFYGGVNYGFGYFGVGFVGGMWAGGHFRYNTAVMHVDPAVEHYTYVNRAVIRTTANHASFNGPGGITARPTAPQVAAEHERHIAPTAAQTNHERNAGANRNNLLSVNHGRPTTMATSRPVAEPANRAGVNHVATATRQSTANRAVSHRAQARPAVASRPATVNRPPASHSGTAAHPSERRSAPVNRQQPAIGAANRAAPPIHRESAVRSAPQHNALPREAPPQHREEPASPRSAANHAAPPTHLQAVSRPTPQHNAPPRQAPAHSHGEHH